MALRVVVLYYTRVSFIKHQNSVLPSKLCFKRLLCSSHSNDDHSSESKKDENTSNDDRQSKVKKPPSSTKIEKQEAAKKKLESLLSDLKVADSVGKRSESLKLSKPPQRLNKVKDVKDQKLLTHEDKLKSAVKEIASQAGSRATEVEAELTDKIASFSAPKEIPKQSDETVESDSEREVEENIMSSVKAVASTVVDDPEPVKSELTKKLLEISMRRHLSAKTDEKEHLLGLFEGIKVEKSQQPERFERKSYPSQAGQPMDFTPWQRPSRPQQEIMQQRQLNIFDSPPLGIFKVKAEEEQEGKTELPKLHIWEKLMEKELKSMVEFAPANPFEEMIMLTEQGKHWKFPIDNEIDMGPEENVGFHEHIFLEPLLDGFPTKGPIRHFMELVVTGLSKNPYITVERKKENIEWFRQYFKEKKDIIQEYL